MTEATERRAVAFIRTVANRCASCMRRSTDNCRNCISSWANEIMSDYERELSQAGREQGQDYSLSARMLKIVDALQKAGCPLLASEIDLSDCCSKQLKHWTLVRMLRLGYLARTSDAGDGRPPYRYRVTRKPFPAIWRRQKQQAK